MTSPKTLDSHSITSQEMLHQLEALCTAEEPAACTAACPLHVDGRALCRLIAEEKWQQAFHLYQKTVPFALILAHTCDAPCEQACLRREAGGALQLHELEKAMARQAGDPGKAPVFRPKKKHRAAVVGAGVRGLTAALELARKGYPVTVFEKTDVLWGKLNNCSPDLLPDHVLKQEAAMLKALNINIEYHREIPFEPAGLAAALLTEFDGVYLSCSSPLDALAHQDTQQIPGYEMILAGKKKNSRRLSCGVAYDMLDGRSAATTLDRLFQNVNIMAGREKEGSYATTLVADLSRTCPKPPQIPPGDTGGAFAPAVREASRCIQCRCERCADKCGFLKAYGKNPRQYIREVYNNLSIAMGTHHANAMINSCALCGQCQEVCPNGLDMSQVFLAARQRMTETKKMPPSAFEFGLLDLDFSLSEAFFLARHQKGHTRSQTLFFPGCQLAASEPELVKEVYRDLCQKNADGTGLMLACCGITARWAGDEERFARAGEVLRSAWQDLGSPLVIAACPTCAAVLKEQHGITAKSLFEILARRPEMPAGRVSPNKVVVHHACGARFQPQIQESVLALAARCGVETENALVPCRESPCCGYGGMVPVANAGIADQLTRTALTQLEQGAPNEPDRPVLTYCINCRDRYLANSKEAFHLLELLYPHTGHIRHAPPGWSTRQDNRTALKQQLLSDFFGETVTFETPLMLYLSQPLADKLEQLHILRSDISQVILHAQQTGEKLEDPDSGHFIAYYRLGNVTFWVEYAPENHGWRVYNAYSHRMEFTLNAKITEGRETTDG